MIVHTSFSIYVLFDAISILNRNIASTIRSLSQSTAENGYLRVKVFSKCRKLPFESLNYIYILYIYNTQTFNVKIEIRQNKTKLVFRQMSNENRLDWLDILNSLISDVIAFYAIQLVYQSASHQPPNQFGCCQRTPLLMDNLNVSVSIVCNAKRLFFIFSTLNSHMKQLNYKSWPRKSY